MDNKKRYKIEEEHDDNMRQLSQAEEMLDDCQREMKKTTYQLLDYVYSFYREIDEPTPQGVNQPFEEVLEDYNFNLRKKREEIEELRSKEQKIFNDKMGF